MKFSVNITFQDIVEIIKQMNLSELEKLKDTIIEIRRAEQSIVEAIKASKI